MNTQLNTLVNFPVVKVAHTATGPSQRKDVSPGVADCYHKEYKLKYVKSVFCVIQLSCVKPVTNVPNVASNLPVGARLQNFWQTWQDLGDSPKDPAQIDEVTNSHKLLCQSSQEPLPVRVIASAYRQKRR